MFNPFPPYHVKYLPAFRQKGVKCFVKQTYERGRNLLENEPKDAFLLSHYTDRGLALEHLDALKTDNKAKILMLDNPADYSELLQLGSTSEHIFMYFKEHNLELKASKLLNKKIQAYIYYKLGWKIPGYEVVRFSLDFIFGEVYAILEHGTRYHQINLREIETTKGYVL